MTKEEFRVSVLTQEIAKLNSENSELKFFVAAFKEENEKLKAENEQLKVDNQKLSESVLEAAREDNEVED